MCEFHWQFITDQPGQPTGEQQKLLACRRVHLAPTSETTPKYPWEALCKTLLLLEKYLVFPTDTNSESDVGDVATHPRALCADQEPTVSGVEITVFDFIFSNQTLTQFSGQS